MACKRTPFWALFAHFREKKTNNQIPRKGGYRRGYRQTQRQA